MHFDPNKYVTGYMYRALSLILDLLQQSTWRSIHWKDIFPILSRLHPAGRRLLHNLGAI